MFALFSCGDPSSWSRVHHKYWDVVEAKAKAKGKTPSKLLNLDQWFQNELPVEISKRPERYVTHSELVKLMQWKLTRGKFRPRLQQLVESNSEESVERCSRTAFRLLPDVQAAVTELSVLKGVGAATASAVLAAGAPDQVAFMSDEAVESVPGLSPVQYTIKHYVLFLSKILEQTEKLNQVDREQAWTPQRLEQCLWAFSMDSKLQLHILKDICVRTKRSSDCEDQKPQKKLKGN